MYCLLYEDTEQKTKVLKTYISAHNIGLDKQKFSA